ncbi:hypothetical protein MF545_00420 [Stenotrophomonas maltophilia]|nr:hypothetical protein [Stenotrophomonas maltophilia]
MSSAAMVSWAIAVVGEFDDAGRRIPERVVQLLPMVDVVLWAKEQPQPLQAESLQAEFGLSRASAYRWLTALQDLHDPAAARGRMPALQPLSSALGRHLTAASRAGEAA